jgi:prevent-host-death family protein
MTQVNIHHAKTHLSHLLLRVAAGETIIIARAGKPIARLVPFATESSDRQPGLDRDHVHIRSDFDTPLPDDLLDKFEA